MIRFAGVALLLLVSSAAVAADPVAFDAIANNDLRAAEAELAPQVAEGSREPGVLLNLAHVYRQTGRSAQAQGLYRLVLATPNAQMARPDGNPAWSHRLAELGLVRTTQLAAR